METSIEKLASTAGIDPIDLYLISKDDHVFDPMNQGQLNCMLGLCTNCAIKLEDMVFTDMQAEKLLSEADFNTLKDGTQREQRKKAFLDEMMSIEPVLEELTEETEE